MRKVLIGLLTLLVVVGFAFSQITTGNLKGTVTDTAGTPLPGVSVVVTGPSLIGQRVVVTDANGNFLVPSIPPGTYTVTATLAGFKKTTKSGVVVYLEKTTSIKVTLEQGEISETLEVTAKAPAVDITDTKVSMNVKKSFFDALPKGRNFQAMVLMAPSVEQGHFGISVGGATGLENQYIIDGINTTDVDLGRVGTNIVYEYIDEVEVKTAGYEAEFSGALGGVVNIITKSGGNEFHGDLLFNYRSDKLYAEPKVTVFGGGAINKFHYYDFGVGIGGYIVKNKLWFFAAGTPSFRKTYYTPVNAYTHKVVNGDYKQNIYNFSTKLTFLPARNHTITLSAFGDPRKGVGGNPGTLRDPNSDYRAKNTGGTYNVAAKYEGMFGTDWIVTALVGRYFDRTRRLPESGNLDKPVLIYQYGSYGYPHGWRTGGFGWYSNPFDKSRWTGKLDITRFWGNHTFKAGFQWYRSIEDRNDHYTGKFYRVYREPRGYYYERYRTTKGDAYTDDFALFVQDSWQIGRLHLNLGIRSESEVLHSTDPSKFFKPHQAVISWGFKDMIAPRFGFSFDVLGDGTTKFFGSYGRFYEIVPMDINARSFGYEMDEIFFYTLSGTLFYDWKIGHEPPPIQPDIKAPYQNEFVLGVERELTKDFTLSVRGIYRKLGRYVEDGSFDGGNVYFLFNPGEWVPTTLKRPSDFTSRCPKEYWNFPKPLRWYKAVEVVLNKHFSHNYQFVASYTYGRAYGNLPGFAFEEYGQSDPNITAEFDFPELMYNAEGYLPNDRKHRFKFDGAYIFPFGLSLGTSVRYISGKPYTAMGYNEWYGPVAFLDKRGTTGRTPSQFFIDLHVAYSYKIAGKYKLTALADIFNVTNNRVMTDIYTSYDNTHYYGYSDDPSTIYPPWTKPAAPSNPYYGEARAYHSPRSAILGLRFEF